jgi:hypothetical protein
MNRRAIAFGSHPPLKREGRIAEGDPGRDRKPLATHSRLASLADLPLSGGGEDNDLLIAIHAPPTLMISSPEGATLHASPLNSTVVVPSSCTIAGPTTRAPAFSAPRW